MASDRLFAYGTLMFPDILARVIGRVLPGDVAVLAGFRRVCVIGEDYPGLIEAAGQQVQGVFYGPLSVEDWHRLDAFEGTEYRRAGVEVSLPDGSTQRADVYVFQAACGHRLSTSEWHPESFSDVAKARFLTRIFHEFTR